MYENRIDVQCLKYRIRPIREKEYPVLKDFLYEAIFQRDQNNLLPKDVIYQPSLYVYIDNYGQVDDNCLVAEADGKLIGAVWTRIIKGFGSIDDTTPEFAISLYKEYRSFGIGTEMMWEMCKLLKG